MMMPMPMSAAAAGNSYSNDTFDATFEKPNAPAGNNNNNDNIYMQASAAGAAGSDNKPFMWESFDDDPPEKSKLDRPLPTMPAP